MAREFKEVAHLRTDKKKYDENYDEIFRKKKRSTAVVEKRVYDKLNCKILPFDDYEALPSHMIVQYRNPDDGNWYDAQNEK